MNKSKLSILLLITLTSGCAIKSGEYLGGFVKVNVSDKGETQELPSEQKKSSEPNMTAQANAQGLCMIGCQSKEPSPMEKMQFSISDVDIDSLYNRIKNEFDFKSRQERIESNPTVEGFLDHTLDFRYRALPGVSYLMRGYKEHNYENEETPNTIQVELFKDGINKVSVLVSYYSGNLTDMSGYEKSLKERVLSASKG